MFPHYYLRLLTSMPLFVILSARNSLLCPTPYSPLRLDWHDFSRKAPGPFPTALQPHHTQGRISGSSLCSLKAPADFVHPVIPATPQNSALLPTAEPGLAQGKGLFGVRGLPMEYSLSKLLTSVEPHLNSTLRGFKSTGPHSRLCYENH